MGTCGRRLTGRKWVAGVWDWDTRKWFGGRFCFAAMGFMEGKWVPGWLEQAKRV